MLPAVLALVAAAPCIYWTQGIESRATLEAAGITRLCVAPEQAEPFAAVYLAFRCGLAIAEHAWRASRPRRTRG